MITDIVIIGRIKSCYNEKWGTPRQGQYCSTGTAVIEFNPLVFSKERLMIFNECSHAIVIFVFNLNRVKKLIETGEDLLNEKKNKIFYHYCSSINAKITPPKIINEEKRGCLATRSPHRPTPIGLTVCKVKGIELNELRILITGIDIIDKTPIIEIIPYTQNYNINLAKVKIPNWIFPLNNDLKKELSVYFSLASFFDITSVLSFEERNESCNIFLGYSFKNEINLFQFITQILTIDTRSRYSKKKVCNQVFGIKVLNKYQLIYQHVQKSNFVRVIRFIPLCNYIVKDLNPRTSTWLKNIKRFTIISDC
ncbi:hypothetical protein FG386_000866 [Cryptosporidium ryanae]|uniref:uncharacterized protein n=1 Tax=Cryptosporidium ryanae TaxID=515981 RepID=UPI00351A42FF|nr:hypothetical protein FG386_000866 [Cryptosporidium ryanae]